MQYDNEKSKSTLLVKLIGIPDICKPASPQLRTENIPGFLQTAEQNKIPLLFLRAAAESSKEYPIKSTLLRYEEKYRRTLDLITFVTCLLEKRRTRYTLFKTLKPFPYTPSDVDVLLWSDEDLKTVTRTLKCEGCVPLERNVYGVTMFSPSHRMNIDLTTQVAVSGLIYMNKELLFDHVDELEVCGELVRTLEPHADILAVTAHSIFKEQMYTLNDYYTFTMLTQHWKETSKLAEKLHLKHALETALRMTEAITSNAFGSSNPLTKEFKALGITHATASSGKDIELPKKYDLATIIVEFFKKITADPLAMNSLSSAAQSFYNPAFYRKIVEHATRGKY